MNARAHPNDVSPSRAGRHRWLLPLGMILMLSLVRRRKDAPVPAPVTSNKAQTGAPARRAGVADGVRPPQSETDTRTVGLLSGSFFGLAALQFLTVLNDNSYRWLLVPIGYHLIGKEHKGLILTLGLACFVVPYVVLTAPAGYLADRFSKQQVMSVSMLAQAAILVMGIGAVLAGNVPWLFSVLALMGAQGALMGPAKNGVIPEIIHAERISDANGYMGMASVMASVVGSVLGNSLYVWTGPVGKAHWWISACVLIGIALLGWLASLLIIKRTAADPDRRPPTHLFAETARQLRTLSRDRRLFGAALASAFFWFLAGLAQVNVYLLGTTSLHIGQEQVGLLLAVLALGVALGSVLAGIWSGGRVEVGITAIGAAGIAASSITMFLLSWFGGDGPWMYFWNGFVLFWMGISSGLYGIPLSSFLQKNSPRTVRGQILAATNFLSFGAMLIASAAFWLARSVLGESAGIIFLGAGLLTVAAWIVMAYYLRRAMLRALRRLVYGLGSLLGLVPGVP